MERLINEPTAAALSYGLEHMEDDSCLPVYDLGGGAFDVTLLELFGGVLDVQASAGDNTLGGKDFDQFLISELERRFAQRTGISLKDSTYAQARLKDAAEQCKITLSTQSQATVRIPMLAQKWGRPQGLEETITREEFEQMIQPLVSRTHEPIRRVLSDGDVAKNALRHIPVKLPPLNLRDPYDALPLHPGKVHILKPADKSL